MLCYLKFGTLSQASRLLTRLALHAVQSTPSCPPPVYTAGQATFETRPHMVQAGDITPGISALEYYERRLRLMEGLPALSVAIVAGNHVKTAAGSVFYQFHQNSDMFYLTGWNEPDSVALLEKINNTDVILHMLVPPKDPFAEQWEGHRTGVDNVRELFNADESAAITELPAYLRHVLGRNGHVYYDPINPPKHNTPAGALRSVFGTKALETASADSITLVLDALPTSVKQRPLRPHTEQMRVVKSQAEIAVMREAGRISGIAYNQAYSQRFQTERTLGSYLNHRFVAGGCDKSAYVPVVAGGANALCIHYTINNDLLRSDEMVLVDAGGSYGGYCADISRTWPNSGVFSDAQRELYQAVLNVQKQCIDICAAGSLSLNGLHTESVKMMHHELTRLPGLEGLSQRDTHVLYPHSIGHNLGIDLHDVMGWGSSSLLQANQVVTIEPGVYVPNSDRFPERFRGIGIRIEDDVVVGTSGCTVLTKEAAKEVEDIELIAREGSLYPEEVAITC